MTSFFLLYHLLFSLRTIAKKRKGLWICGMTVHGKEQTMENHY
ncbi:hypothetical protein B4114_2949 [Geobacillus stearothermophilus]|uniref:Uncharacterized protein n=1 Tax=Geobacillus stearothermophilus TaxID=1422 RepID=A0A150N231_GEOSE|nr:hypothetical protein B4114_2949 [Geobacillus stearothermophilus]